MEAYFPSMSYPSSPQSSSLPSPPSSPGSSFSSLPSSAFSLSVPSSPPRHDSPQLHPTHSFILPSLSLDTTERTTHNLSGETLGHVNLLIVGAKGSGKTLVAETLVHGNPDVVDVGEWANEATLGRVLSAETRMEGEPVGAPGNVRVVETVGFDQTDDPQTVAAPILAAIHARFHSVLPLLSQTYPSNRALRDLLASSQSQFFTAVLLLTSSPTAPTPLENSLLTLLSTHIPIIPITSPTLPLSSRSSSRAARRPPASLRPLTPHHLRHTLFRCPAALRALRCEAAERFLWWREVEAAKSHPRTLEMLLSPQRGDEHAHDHNQGYDDQLESASEKWAWETRLSRDVALARESASTDKDNAPLPPLPCPFLPLDPLHVPSLFLLSLSLLRPLRDSVTESVKAGVGVGMRWWAVTIVSAFCAGVGVGWLLGGVAL